MIRVNYAKDGDRHKLSVQGHAGHGPPGGDIVCAGVSALSYALLGYLLQAECPVVEAKADSGDLLLICEDGEMVRGAFDMALMGYLQIAKKYPRNVDVYISGLAGDTREETAT